MKPLNPLISASCMTSLALMLSSTAMADPTLKFDVAVNPNPLQIVQNNTGAATFTVTLSMATTAPIVKGYVDYSTLANTAIQFIGGDNQDAIGGGRLVPGGTCFGFVNGKPNSSNIFALGRQCTFMEQFPTSDGRDPDPDNIPGNWGLNEVVKMYGLDANNNKVTSLAQKAYFNATVLDTAAPEPGSLLLIASAFAGLGVARRLRKSRTGEPRMRA